MAAVGATVPMRPERFSQALHSRHGRQIRGLLRVLHWARLPLCKSSRLEAGSDRSVRVHIRRQHELCAVPAQLGWTAANASLLRSTHLSQGWLM
jgi:hypothetical protein